MRPALAILNAVLPGSGLVIEGRYAWGLTLLLPAIPLVAVVIAAMTVLGGAFADDVRAAALGAYACLGAGAILVGAIYARRARIDPVQVRAIHRAACAAWLTARSPAELAKAIHSARAVVTAAPEEAGAWRFLARVATDAGEKRLAHKADTRADAIEAR
jgi:hypothetical protein